MPRLRHSLLLFVLVLAPRGSGADPDRQSEAIVIGPGASPALAVDEARRTLHLVYRLDDKLLHRTGNFGGRFSEAETVFVSASPPPGLWDPRVVLDRDGNPHVVWADGHYQNRFTWYARRGAAGWSPPTVVFDKAVDRLNRATMPHLVLEADGRTAYVGAFTVGGPEKGEGDEWGILARIDALDTMPAVMQRRRIMAWNPQLALVDGELWVGGRNIRTPDRQFALQRFDKVSLAPLEPPVPLSGARHGEIARIAVDAHGDLHAAGTLNNAKEAAVAGWYTTLAHARAGQPALTYLTSNRNASGAAMPVPDAREPGRVYLVHWHGAAHDHHEPPAGAEGNYLHYVRIENGEKVVEGRKISDRSASHGHSYRHTPCAAAHPDGGLFVVIQETGTPDHLVFTTIGVPAP